MHHDIIWPDVSTVDVAWIHVDFTVVWDVNFCFSTDIYRLLKR
jgi:hypothetical protein